MSVQLALTNSLENESHVVSCSFRDALGQAGFCCGGSGTGLQKAAACKRAVISLLLTFSKVVLTNTTKSCSLLRHNFSEVIIQRQTLLPQVVMESKSLQQFQQASKQLPGREIIDVCSIRSCIPNVLCRNSRNAASVRRSPSAQASQRGTGDLVSFLPFL